MPVSRDEYVVQDDEPTAALVDGEVFMLSARAQSYFGLGETGSKIWNLLRQPRKVSEICDELVQAYDVEPDACERANGLESCGGRRRCLSDWLSSP
jgi:hypothetical protein